MQAEDSQMALPEGNWRVGQQCAGCGSERVHGVREYGCYVITCSSCETCIHGDEFGGASLTHCINDLNLGFREVEMFYYCHYSVGVGGCDMSRDIACKSI